MESAQSCYANRMIHPGSQQMFIGPFAVDGTGNIRTIEALLNTERLGAMALDVKDPDNYILMVSMDGPLYRVNVETLDTVQIFDLKVTLGMKEQPHFKAAWTVGGLFYVGANTWDEADYVEQVRANTALHCIALPYGPRHGTRHANTYYTFPPSCPSYTFLPSCPSYTFLPSCPSYTFLPSCPSYPSDYTLSSPSTQPGAHHGGRFASWDGGSTNDSWTIISTDSTVEIASRFNFGKVIFVLQLDDASVILRVKDLGDDKTESYDKDWQIYRLPRATSTQNHLWSCEWPRIREVITERYLMNGYGLLYELSSLGYDGAVWGVKPISQTLRIIPDWTQFAGFLVLGSNQNSPIFDNNIVTGQASSGLLFTYEDALWQFGKPQGWGGPWRYDIIKAGQASDPYLMTGFDKKMGHFRCDAIQGGLSQPGDEEQQAEDVTFTLQVDFLGQAGHLGTPWNDYIDITVPTGGYAFHNFPSGFSAHWVRVVSNSACNATAWFTYT